MTRYWQDLTPGEQFATGTIGLSREDILAFAAEFDPQPYHLDKEAAAASIFGGLCASGWQVSALMMRLLTEALRARQIAVTGVEAVPRLRWRMPVFAGDSLAASVIITKREADSRLSGSGTVAVEVAVTNQDGKPVIELSSRLQVAHREHADGQ